MTTSYYRHRSAEARETLSLGLAHGRSLRTMARILRRAPSPLSREVARNTSRDRPNRAWTAHRLAAARACQPRRVRKLLDPWLWPSVQSRLGQGCSPEPIAGRLHREDPDDMRTRLAAETIYAALYGLPRGALRSELRATLRQARGADRRGQILNLPVIAGRPAEVAARTVPGHWDGDLSKGARNGSAVGTLGERTTRLVILARMEETEAVSARAGFTRKLRHVPTLLRKTLTDDRGNEMAEHERLAQRLAIQVFVADPHSPWQRGTNENTTGLLRQDLPKGTDLSGYTQRALNAIAHRLKTRPRECLNVATPLEVFTQLRHHSPVARGT